MSDKSKATKDIPSVTPEVMRGMGKRKPYCVQWTEKGSNPQRYGKALVWATDSATAKILTKKLHGDNITMTAPIAFWKWAVAVMQGRYSNVDVIHGQGDGHYLQGRQQMWEMGNAGEYNLN